MKLWDVRRGPLELRIDTLQAIAEGNELISRIIRRANINECLLQVQIDALSTLELITVTDIGSRRLFHITPNGKKWLSVIQTAREAIMNGQSKTLP